MTIFTYSTHIVVFKQLVIESSDLTHM